MEIKSEYELKKAFIIFETNNFRVETLEEPQIPREDGGHIIVNPKQQYLDRTELPINLAIELMLLSMVVGEAMQIVLSRKGVEIKRINYQENGNWAFLQGEKPFLHLHLYGRTVSSKTQKFGESLFLPSPRTNFYYGFRCLTEDDILAIRDEIIKIINTDKYRNEFKKNRVA